MYLYIVIEPEIIFNFSETVSTLETLILVYDCISWTCAKVTLLIHSEIDKQKFQMISSQRTTCLIFLYLNEFLICVGKLLHLYVLAHLRCQQSSTLASGFSGKTIWMKKNQNVWRRHKAYFS